MEIKSFSLRVKSVAASTTLKILILFLFSVSPAFSDPIYAQCHEVAAGQVNIAGDASVLKWNSIEGGNFYQVFRWSVSSGRYESVAFNASSYLDASHTRVVASYNSDNPYKRFIVIYAPVADYKMDHITYSSGIWTAYYGHPGPNNDILHPVESSDTTWDSSPECTFANYFHTDGVLGGVDFSDEPYIDEGGTYMQWYETDDEEDSPTYIIYKHNLSTDNWDKVGQTVETYLYIPDDFDETLYAVAALDLSTTSGYGYTVAPPLAIHSSGGYGDWIAGSPSGPE